MMTIKKDYILICENLLADDTGKVTMVNVFDTVYADIVPTFQGSISLVAQLIVEGSTKADEDKTKVSLKVLNPAKQVILNNEVKIKINSQLPLQKNAIGLQLNGMPLESFGTYQFILEWNDKKIAQRNLDVVKGGINEARIK